MRGQLFPSVLPVSGDELAIFCWTVVISSFAPREIVPAFTAAAMLAASPMFLSSSMASVTSFAKSAGCPSCVKAATQPLSPTRSVCEACSLPRIARTASSLVP